MRAAEGPGVFAQAGSHSGNGDTQTCPLAAVHTNLKEWGPLRTGLQPRGDAIKRNYKVSAFFSLLFPRAFPLHLHGCSCMLAGTHRPTCRHSLLGIPFVPALNMRVSPMSSMRMLWGMNTGGRNGDSSIKVSRMCQDLHDWEVHIGRLFQVKAVR